VFFIGVQLDHHKDHTMHFLTDYQNCKPPKCKELIIVSYQLFAFDERYYRLEEVTYVHNNNFISKLIPDYINRSLYGDSCEVFPYESKYIKIYENSLKWRELDRLMKNVSTITDADILPEDAEEAVLALRILKKLRQRKYDWSKEQLRNERKRMWDLIYASCPDYDFSHLNWNNPYNDDWDQNPNDYEFNKGFLSNKPFCRRYRFNDLVEYSKE